MTTIYDLTVKELENNQYSLINGKGEVFALPIDGEQVTEVDWMGHYPDGGLRVLYKDKWYGFRVDLTPMTD